jgi:DNA invertase Pin-like site-specific DNA recombinase
MANPHPVACYLRSSKDRSEVSIDAQRRELATLAASRGWTIVREYVDVVESGKDTYRNGFQTMLRDLKAPGRAWRTLLMVDTSRLSRRRYAAQAFKHEAKKRGVEILYSNVPEVDPITSVILESVFEAFDEVHSLMSREKGLGGMAENIQKGFRAGGRAPRGYRLRHIETGAMREGAPVTKSVLEPSQDAPMIARYLSARAAGTSRRAARATAAIAAPETSLVALEWNALAYAGHTTWNVHNEHVRGEGYKNGIKRRPRSEWHIKRDTHPALITDAQAETILATLESNPHRTRRRTDPTYLLTGVLQAPDGTPWHGNGAGRYRNKKHAANADQAELENAVIDKMLSDMQSTRFVTLLTLQAKRYSRRHRGDPAAATRRDLAQTTAQISTTMDFCARLADPAPALRKIDELETRRRRLEEEIAAASRDYETARALDRVTTDQVAAVLAGAVADMRCVDRENMKELIASLVERIELEPKTYDCRIHYRIGIRDNLASPRPCAVIPILRLVSRIKVA